MQDFSPQYHHIKTPLWLQVALRSFSSKAMREFRITWLTEDAMETCWENSSAWSWKICAPKFWSKLFFRSIIDSLFVPGTLETSLLALFLCSWDRNNSLPHSRSCLAWVEYQVFQGNWEQIGMPHDLTGQRPVGSALQAPSHRWRHDLKMGSLLRRKNVISQLYRLWPVTRCM